MRRLVLLAVPLVALMAACGDDDAEYHSGGPRSILLCEHPEPPVGE